MQEGLAFGHVAQVEGIALLVLGYVTKLPSYVINIVLSYKINGISKVKHIRNGNKSSFI